MEERHLYLKERWPKWLEDCKKKGKKKKKRDS